MSPLWGKDNGPDDRPSQAEILMVVALALLVVAAIWLDGLLNSVQP